MGPQQLELPATLSGESGRRTHFPGPALMPRAGTLGRPLGEEGPAGAGHLGGPHGLSPPRPGPLPVAQSRRLAPRLPAAMIVAGECGPGSAWRSHQRPPPALPEREARLSGCGKETRRGQRGRGRPPLFPSRASRVSGAEHARAWGACAVASSRPPRSGLRRGAWEPGLRPPSHGRSGVDGLGASLGS